MVQNPVFQISDPTVIVRSGDPHPGAAVAHPGVRIPALAVLPSGRILLAHDVRPADQRDLPGPIDIVVRHSDDHGRTWNQPRLLRPHVEAADDGRPRGYGDPSLIVDPTTGRVLCWYVGSYDRSFWDSEAGPDGEGQELWCSISDDDGLTWSHREFTRALKPTWATGMFASSGNGTVITDAPYAGRLLQPFVLRSTEGEHFTAIAHSDDHGLHWTLGEPVGPDCDETKVLALPAGGGGEPEVLLHARSSPHRWVARSSDGGVTFTRPTPDEALVDPRCNGGLTLWGDTVVSSLPDHDTRRLGLVVRLSDDRGETWDEPTSLRLVTGEPAAYSVVAELADGALGLVWESGPKGVDPLLPAAYSGISFVRITR